ncbi:MAG TPA: hypothetical protein VK361_07815 [Rubrobacteraceae bacterium]|nr:hypothetical protein [Rubrobacteraceae bacterium]
MTLGDGSTFEAVHDRPFTHQDLIRHLWWLLDNRPQERERIKEILGEFVESEMEEDDAYHALQRVSEEVLELPWEDALKRALFIQAITKGDLELLKDPDDEEDEEASAEPGGGDVG